MPGGGEHGVDLSAKEEIDPGQLNDAHSDPVTLFTQPFRM